MKTLNLGLVITAALLLSGCGGDPPHEINDRANRQFRHDLPEGCTIKYLGKLDRGNITDIPMVAVICEGRKVTSTSYLYSSGKYTYPAVTFAISEKEI